MWSAVAAQRAAFMAGRGQARGPDSHSCMLMPLIQYMLTLPVPTPTLAPACRRRRAWAGRGGRRAACGPQSSSSGGRRGAAGAGGGLRLGAQLELAKEMRPLPLWLAASLHVRAQSSSKDQQGRMCAAVT